MFPVYINGSESLSCPGSYGMPLRPIISTSHVLQTAAGSGIHRNHQTIIPNIYRYIYICIDIYIYIHI